MANVKISSKVEEDVWEDLRQMAAESHQSISGLLTEAIRDYLRRRRVRPEVLSWPKADAATALRHSCAR